MSKQSFSFDVNQEVFSEDSLLSFETMQSFLSILDGLRENCLQKATNDDGNERNKTLMLEHNFGTTEAKGQTTPFAEESGEREDDKKPLAITKFNELTNHSSRALHMNRMLFSTSLKNVSVPSAFYKASRETYNKLTPILRASSLTSKELTAQLIAASRLSKGATIMRSTGSMWMTKAPKSKSFPNYIMPAIDTTIMKFEEDLDVIEEVKDPEFCKIIEAATPKAKTTDHARNQGKGNTTSPVQNVIDANLSNHDLCGTNKSENLDNTSVDYTTKHEIVFENDLYGQAISDNLKQSVEHFEHTGEPQRKLCHWKEDVEYKLQSASDKCVLPSSSSVKIALDPTDKASTTCSSRSDSTLSIHANDSLERNIEEPDDTHDDSEENDDEVDDFGTAPFGEDSVFGILGVYCNSELHNRYRENTENHSPQT